MLSTFKLIRRISVYMKKYRFKLLISFLFTIAGSVMNVAFPEIVRRIADTFAAGINASIDTSALLRYSLIALILIMGGFVFIFLQNILLPLISQLMSRDIREDMNKKIDRIPLSYFDARQNGDTLSRVTTDVDTFANAVTNNMSGIISAVVAIIGALAMMLFINVILTLIVSALSIAFFMFNTFLMKKSQPYFYSQQNLLGTVNAKAEEAISGHLVIKSFGGEQHTKQDFSESNDKLAKDSWLSQFISGMMLPVMNVGGQFCNVAVVFAGVFLMLRGISGVTIGMIIAFVSYSQIFSMMLSNISQFIASLQPALAATSRIIELMDAEEITECEAPKVPDEVKGDITFRDVKFGYVSDKIIINDFSADVKAGSKIAIVGPTGAGKSTIMNLLMRFYELNGGKILIDGVSISELTRSRLHEFIGLVPQEIWTFEGSIRDNIVYSTEGVSEDRLNDILEASGLIYFIRAMPEGVDTVINEQSNLSTGQRQLITIARAMTKDSPVLILDEATSSVDTRTEKLIQSALDKLMAGRTSFIIAHRLSTIQNADMILVLKDGDIAETGRHDELLAMNGVYADLYRSQFDTK
jgi:ATP-binding cassette subfamily B protein